MQWRIHPTGMLRSTSMFRRAPRRTPRALAGALAAIAACAACTAPASTSEPSCPSDLPSCPSAPPSYSTQVAPIIEHRCLTCHGTNGIAAAKHDFTTYDVVYSQRSAILNQVYSCSMPPGHAEPLAAQERAELLEWLVCHAPRN